MKALTLWQPWASLWLTPAKIHETRHWPTSHRGVLAVHAAKRPIDVLDEDVDDDLVRVCEREFGRHWATELPLGAFVGAVKIVACTSMLYVKPAHDDDEVCGYWSADRYAFKRGDAVKFERPIPYRGRQLVFEAPDDLFPPLVFA